MKQFKVTERYIGMDEFIKIVNEKRVQFELEIFPSNWNEQIIEAFGAGTAMTLAPVELIHYDGVDYKIPVDAEHQAGEITRTISKKIKDIQV